MSKENNLIEAVYSELDYNSGKLFSTAPNFKDSEEKKSPWLEIGDWLKTAHSIGIHKVYFVENNPIILFVESDSTDSNILIELYNKSWNMMRPKLLYVLVSGELTLYSLNEEPVKDESELENRALRQVVAISEIQTNLKDYTRENIESYTYEKNISTYRGAEARFIEDLISVRDALIAKGLSKKSKYVHSLIGRSIFIRYLEDRKILTWNYFESVALKNKKWMKLLGSKPVKPDLDQKMSDLLFFKVLSNHEFTYALFDQLSKDFNGDLFASDIKESEVIKQELLDLLKSFLLGEANSDRLFFWAYKFDIIPIEIISTIYEAFYHLENTTTDEDGKSKSTDKKGTNYTPSTLVEFLVSDVLKESILAKNPKILDPACGSGIFLVESFKRIVRYKTMKNGRRLSFDQLKSILKDQIFGIEINPEALRITSFSLYLALLNYLEPKDIQENIKKGNKLPNLIYDFEEILKPKKEIFNTLVRANTFQLEDYIKEANVLNKFVEEKFDVVLGNPPWGSKLDKKSKDIIANWCEDKNYPIGDIEPSQAFIARSTFLLKEIGIVGLLVSSGVFFKHGKSNLFRYKWLSENSLKKIVNCDHVRDIFFSGGRNKDAISPFASIIFTNDKPNSNTAFEYWTAKKISNLNNTKVVILHKTDLKIVNQADTLSNPNLWKIYWWGGHRDKALTDYLDTFSKLKEFVDSEKTVGRGYQKSGDLKKFEVSLNELPIGNFKRYGKINSNNLIKPPEEVHRQGNLFVYSGERILLGRGIRQRDNQNGIIIARYDIQDFCFTNAIIGLKLLKPTSNKYKILLAILWSSLSRYYLFLISTDWGRWHHEVFVNEFLNLPIQFPKDKKLENKIIKIVDELRNTEEDGSPSEGLFPNKISKLEKELDDAIFELYGLNENEIELIQETCDLKLDLLYNNTKSKALEKLKWNYEKLYGLEKDLEIVKEKDGLMNYALSFLSLWNPKLSPKGEIIWQILCPDDSPMIGFIFYTHEKNKSIPKLNASSKEWKQILNDFSDKSLTQNAKQIYTDGIIRIISEQHILIIKRNERRLWTKTSAVEDAEAILVQAIHKQRDKKA
ncbi:MAG: N-6 DNA methylase [Leptospiraceae bacterium]|nr:N-6 DNA methylase [Leptospiraceae bacterium]